MGYRYGPVLVAREEFEPSDLRGKTVAVPGTMTTAFLLLKIFEPDVNHCVIMFDKIVDALLSSEDGIDAGLLIHEGQLTYSGSGLKKIIDFGEWWYEITRLPLPLGGNVARRDLGDKVLSKISTLLKWSIEYALDNRDEALEYALQFARGMDRNLVDRFIEMYVNKFTLDYKGEGHKAVQLLLEMGYEKGIISKKPKIEFVK
jgi:1,4-dihydroxy-6-naphthoate synthase